MSPAGERSRLQFELRGDTQEVMAKVQEIRAFLLEAGCDAASAQQLSLVAEEILTNIVREAWPEHAPGFCRVEVEAARGPGSMQVTLRTEDDGIAFNPNEAALPELDASLDERTIGGLGIFLVRAMTDTQAYQRVAGRNIFEVRKACALASTGS